MIAQEKLRDDILDDQGNPMSYEAEAIDDMVYCYVPDKQFRKNEVQLTKYVEKNYF